MTRIFIRGVNFSDKINLDNWIHFIRALKHPGITWLFPCVKWIKERVNPYETLQYTHIRTWKLIFRERSTLRPQRPGGRPIHAPFREAWDSGENNITRKRKQRRQENNLTAILSSDTFRSVRICFGLLLWNACRPLVLYLK